MANDLNVTEVGKRTAVWHYVLQIVVFEQFCTQVCFSVLNLCSAEKALACLKGKNCCKELVKCRLAQFLRDSKEESFFIIAN